MASSLEILNAARIQFLLYPPECIIVQTATTSTIATGLGWTSVGFADGAVIDNYTSHSNVTNNTRVTIQVAGWYTVGGAVCYAPNATGVRGARCSKNGTAIQGSAIIVNNVGGVVDTSVDTAAPRDVQCAVGDYIELQTNQTSGANLATAIAADLGTFLQVKFSHF